MTTTTTSPGSGLRPYLAAGFPAVAVETAEEDRLRLAVLADFPTAPVFAVSAVGGLKDARTGATVDAQATFAKAFAITATREEAVLLVFDFQAVVRNAGAYRALKDTFPRLKDSGSCVVLVAPAWSLPPELEHDLPVLQFSLPTRSQLTAALHLVAGATGQPLPADAEAPCLDAAAGLTLQEAENAFALAYAERGRFDAARVEEEKMRLVRQSGLLEVSPPADPASVGGLLRLKEYLSAEVLPTRDDPELRVRGILLVGVPGTGKSLASKAAGALLGWPVLRMDVAALKGSLVGQSEGNMRSALKICDAVAPAVLWIDEIEKGVGGYASSAHTDSGVTLGMVGALLTWMQEHSSPVIVVATCNDYAKLPAELTRAGRFDERFFVDLPTPQERAEIAAVHLARLGCPADGLAGAITELTADWTGAEIEQLVKSAARRSARRPTADVLAACAREIKPISRVRAQEIEALRSWARTSLRLANTPEASTSAGLGRRVRGGGQ